MGQIQSTHRTATFLWDFAEQGGAVGAIRTGIFIPNNAVINFGYAKVLTTLTSGGAATISVDLNSTGDLVAALAVASWTANTVIEGVDLIVAMIEATADREVTLTIATAALTAGKFLYTLHYDQLDM